MSTEDIIQGVYKLDSPDDLIAVRAALKQRGSELAARVAAQLKPNDTVRFSDLISPRYMVGKEATVVKINAKSVVVNCPDDPSYRKYRNAKNVRCPNSLIEGLA